MFCFNETGIYKLHSCLRTKIKITFEIQYVQHTYGGKNWLWSKLTNTAKYVCTCMCMCKHVDRGYITFTVAEDRWAGRESMLAISPLKEMLQTLRTSWSSPYKWIEFTCSLSLSLLRSHIRTHTHTHRMWSTSGSSRQSSFLCRRTPAAETSRRAPSWLCASVLCEGESRYKHEAVLTLLPTGGDKAQLY